MGRQISNPQAVTVQGTINTLQSQSGRQPGTPTITSPANGTNITSFSPTFSSSAFFVYNGTDTHAGSNWQIATDQSFSNIVFDLATRSALISWTPSSTEIPRTVGTYFVRVRYISNANEISVWSQPIAFNVTREITITPTFNGSTQYNIRLQYAGTAASSDPTSFNVRISANSNMSSSLVNTNVSASNRIADLAVNYTALPGLTTGTPYFIEVTPVAGTAAVVTPFVQQLASPIVTASIAPPAYVLASNSVQQHTTAAVTSGTAPAGEWQYSTSSAFTTTTFTSSASSFANTSLPGIENRTQAYWVRYVLIVGGDRPVLLAPARLSARSSVTSAGAYSSSVPASYSGAITVIAIGGGGGGGGSGFGAAGGGGSGFAVQHGYTVTGGQTFSGTVGTGGSAGSWTSDGGVGGQTTFTLSGQATLTSNGGNGGRANTNGGQGGTGGANGASFGTSGGRGGGGTGLYGLGGLNGGPNTTGPGGQGGFGWGAGGGGAVRDNASGSSGNFPGGGGGGLAFDQSIQAANGQWGNVTDGGAGLRGAVFIQFVEW